jgi:hypothetical protein
MKTDKTIESMKKLVKDSIDDAAYLDYELIEGRLLNKGFDDELAEDLIEISLKEIEQEKREKLKILLSKFTDKHNLNGFRPNAQQDFVDEVMNITAGWNY